MRIPPAFRPLSFQPVLEAPRLAGAPVNRITKTEDGVRFSGDPPLPKNLLRYLSQVDLRGARDLRTVSHLKANLQSTLQLKTINVWQNIANELRHSESVFWPMAEEILCASLGVPRILPAYKASAWMGLGKLCGQRQAHEQERECGKIAMETDPNNLFILRWYAGMVAAHCPEQKQEYVPLYERLLEMARIDNDKIYQAHAFIGLGGAQYEPTKQLGYFRQALSLAEEAGEAQLQAKALLGLGNTPVQNGHTRGDQEQYFRRAITITEAIHDPVLQTLAYTGLGYLYLNSFRNPKQAAKMFQTAIDTAPNPDSKAKAQRLLKSIRGKTF